MKPLARKTMATSYSKRSVLHRIGVWMADLKFVNIAVIGQIGGVALKISLKT